MIVRNFLLRQITHQAQRNLIHEFVGVQVLFNRIMLLQRQTLHGIMGYQWILVLLPILNAAASTMDRTVMLHHPLMIHNNLGLPGRQCLLQDTQMVGEPSFPRDHSSITRKGG